MVAHKSRNPNTTRDSAVDTTRVPDRSQRTVVFIDNQNMYKGAREAFGWEAQIGRFGNFRPYGLGRILVRDPSRTLTQVRVYTGVPTSARDKAGNASTQRRMAAWIADKPEKVQIFPRPLKYPPAKGREKGVDVELAIDFVRLALNDEYDVGVLASCDTDLVPALQFVSEEFPEKTICTVGWQAEPGFEANTNEPLDLPGGGVTRHKLSKRDFDRIADRRNFWGASDDPAVVVGPDRWAKIEKRI
jgi:uncharacterized LabA/DUF88 family protein